MAAGHTRIRILNICHLASENGGVAQLGEHLPCKQGVRGSIPLISTTSLKLDTNSARLKRIGREVGGSVRMCAEESLWQPEANQPVLTKNGLIAQVVRAHA